MADTYIVGTGAVGCAFAGRLKAAGQPVRFVSRTGTGPDPLPGVPRDGLEDVRLAGSRLLIAVPDDVLNQVAARLDTRAGAPSVCLHTAGCLGADALKPLQEAGAACGVLHPLASLPAQNGTGILEGAWFGLSGDDAACLWGRELVGLWRGRILDLQPGRQALYHAAAVAASNHLVALLDSAAALMEAAGVEADRSREALICLAQGSLEQVERLGPTRALTGPVRRGDSRTVSRHLDALRTHLPEEAVCFAACARRTVRLAGRAGLERADAVNLDSLLEAFEHEMRTP